MISHTTDIEQTKRCTTCRMVKPYSEFWENKKHRDGRCSRCKSCYIKLEREIRYPKRKLSESYKALRRKESAAYIHSYPEKARAHRLARLHKDKLLKEACEKCGSNMKLHMHHPDYSKPLEVVTLCIPCHEEVHHGVAA